MSAGLARNWWTVALRGGAAVLFVVCILTLPPPTLASLVLLLAAYAAADGALAILAGFRAARRGERWGMLILEGATNLTLAGTVLFWHAITITPFVYLTSAWAIVTGALMLAAARRLSISHGRWLLVFAGAVSAGWGIALAAFGPSSTSGSRAIGLWLVAYAVVFGIALLALAARLYRGHHEAIAPSVPNR
jgi:uncharacterized membrane protein HdeD (DUF308 family)